MKRGPTDLRPAEAGALRALWQRRDVLPAGGTTAMLARWSGFKYANMWRACTSLHGRGYLDRSGRAWLPNWHVIDLGHRAQFVPLLDRDTPEEAELVLGEPTLPRRIAESLSDWFFQR